MPSRSNTRPARVTWRGGSEIRGWIFSPTAPSPIPDLGKIPGDNPQTPQPRLKNATGATFCSNRQVILWNTAVHCVDLAAAAGKSSTNSSRWRVAFGSSTSGRRCFVKGCGHNRPISDSRVNDRVRHVQCLLGSRQHFGIVRGRGCRWSGGSSRMRPPCAVLRRHEAAPGLWSAGSEHGTHVNLTPCFLGSSVDSAFIARYPNEDVKPWHSIL